MNDFLYKLMETERYVLKENTSLKIFGNEYEFFIFEHFEEDELETFFETDKLDTLISKFQEIEDNKIKKNTSLFVLVKVNNIEKFYNQHLPIMMNIEEDEYYFRKYIILYTEEDLNKLIPDTQYLLDYIGENSDETNVETLFDKFEKNMFFDITYFIAMQLIIKLPFISIPHSEDYFEMIEDRITSKIEKENLLDSEKQVNRILELLNDENIKEQLENEDFLDKLNQILED